MKRRYASLLYLSLAATTALAAPAFAQQNSNTQATACQNLDQLIQFNRAELRQEWINEANNVLQAGDTQPCLDYYNQAATALGDDLQVPPGEQQSQQAQSQQNLQSQQNQGLQQDQQLAGQQRTDESGEIVITQPEPQIAVRQPQPNVTVQQGQPQIQVVQARPTVRVQMQQPTITIDQPAPEIIVRMPDPNVQLSNLRPQVEVRQAEPQVRVEQQQAGLDIRTPEGEPQIRVQRQSPNVEYDAAQPQIDFEMVGEPQIRFSQTGEPQVRFEQLDQQDTAATQQQGQQGQQFGDGQQVSQSEMTGSIGQENQAIPRDAQGEVDVIALITLDSDRQAAGQQQAMLSSDIVGENVYNGNNVDLGTIDTLVSADGVNYAVLGTDSILSDGQNAIVLPLANIEREGNRLVLRGLTDQELAELRNYDDSRARELSSNAQVNVATR